MTKTELRAYNAVVIDDQQFGQWDPFLQPTTTTPSTNLALLATSDELAMWQARAVNGPFKVSGDFSTNSPGHWTEMQAAMSVDFSVNRWYPTIIADGSESSHPAGAVRRIIGTWPNNDPSGSARRSAHDMMSAAYAALILENTSTPGVIRQELEWHASHPRLDFSNRTLYPYGYYADLNPMFMICIWAIDLALAYDIIKSMGFSSTLVENWFLDLADLAEQAVHETLSTTEPGFANRKSDDYSVRGSNVDTRLRGSTRLADGSIVYHLNASQHYNNRRHAQAGFYGLAGMLTGTQEYIDECKRYAREWLMFGHRTTPNQETFGDHDRGNDSYPQLGLSYDFGGLGHLLPALEAIARSGDTSVYDFSSSEGSANATWGSDHLKTFEEILDQRIRWITGNIVQYAGSGDPPSSGVAGDPAHRIKTRTPNGNELVSEAHLLMPAMYYGRTDWVDAIMRKGTPTGFTAVPRDMGTIVGWRVDWRHRFLRSFDANPYGGA